MITYVNTVLVGKGKGLYTGDFETLAQVKDTPSEHANKFIVYDLTNDKIMGGAERGNDKPVTRIRIGLITGKNVTVRKNNNGIVTTEFPPIIKWSNDIQKDNIKSVTKTVYSEDKESDEKVVIDFSGMENADFFAEGGKRIVVRLTFKDLPTRYRKWTESYEYVTKKGDDATKIAAGIASKISSDYKRARVYAKSNGATVTLEAMKYNDDDMVESISWANNVRFNVNMYFTDPQAPGFASKNKYTVVGATITKTPGKWYTASAKLVRDREAQARGYMGILNQGECTFPVIRPDLNVDLNAKYDSYILEFENMYRAADDIFRKTKQTVEIYGINGSGDITGVEGQLNKFLA